MLKLYTTKWNQNISHYETFRMFLKISECTYVIVKLFPSPFCKGLWKLTWARPLAGLWFWIFVYCWFSPMWSTKLKAVSRSHVIGVHARTSTMFSPCTELLHPWYRFGFYYFNLQILQIPNYRCMLLIFIIENRHSYTRAHTYPESIPRCRNTQ